MPAPHPRLPVNGTRYSPASSLNPLKRPRTPMNDDRSHTGSANGHAVEKEHNAGEERRRSRLKDLYARSERMIAGLLEHASVADSNVQEEQPGNELETLPHVEVTRPAPVQKRNARTIDEDDYGGDEDEEEDDDADPLGTISPLQGRSSMLPKPNGIHGLSSPGMLTPKHSMDLHRSSSLDLNRIPSSIGPVKTSEEARKQLEEEKKAAEDAAKESSQTLFYTLENDRDAMLEQKKLDDLDQQVEAEAAGSSNAVAGPDGAAQRGTLSNTNLGASSLTLKHLISRIDLRRHMVRASDAQLRTLMSEVRKNRSKWASEEKVHQEELYEAAERVLMELKAKTEWASPFLQKVNKRDAPDYYNVIKHPMDIGTMLKKLKNLAYQSKKEFVDDLDLIWTNCLRYNANPEHLLRKKAEHMKKETAKLIPLIPDVVIKSRAEVEAEERRLQIEFGDVEESDEEPLRTVRGRKAPGKSSKKGTTTARKAPPTDESGTPAPDARGQPPNLGPLSAIANLKNEHLRNDFDSGLSTPPPRTGTPFGPNGNINSAPFGSQADMSELEMLDVSVVGGASAQQEDLEHEDDDYKTWKQVTKKDRAQVAAERHRLFDNDRINPDEPALLRTKAGMRRWMRLQKSTTKDERMPGATASKPAEDAHDGTAEGTTLAEEIDGDLDCVLPDYYDPLASIPHLSDRLSWREDADGQVIDQMEDCLRMVPEGYFTSPRSLLTTKFEANMRQMQESRKIVAKIAIVKQMQLQTQTYQNQFQKYEPEPFSELDIPPHVTSDEGPIMTPWACRAALQRSVGRLFYIAGFEEFQPSALEAMTDIASKYFTDLVRHLSIYTESPKVYTTVPAESPATLSTKKINAALPATAISNNAPTPVLKLIPRYSQEEAVLHMLRESGHDLESLEYYAKDDTDRLSSKLETHHARTRDYLAELLRPALDPGIAGNDGAGVFNDGSEQFVGGDFAEDIGEDFFGFKELGLDKEFGIAGFSVPLHLLQSRMATAYQPANATAISTTGLVMELPVPYPPLTTETLEEQIGLVKDFFREKLEKAGEHPIVEDEDLPPKQRFPRPRLPPTGKISSPRKRPIREQQMLARKKRRQEIEAEREREREAAAANAPTNGGVNGSMNGLSNTSFHEQSASLVNGDSTLAEQDADGDHDSPANDGILQHERQITSKLIGKVRLDAPRDSGGNGHAGDPTKQPQPQGNVDGDQGDDGAGTNGMLSPESVVIAAH